MKTMTGALARAALLGALFSGTLASAAINVTVEGGTTYHSGAIVTISYYGQKSDGSWTGLVDNVYVTNGGGWSHPKNITLLTYLQAVVVQADGGHPYYWYPEVTNPATVSHDFGFIDTQVSPPPSPTPPAPCRGCDLPIEYDLNP